MLCYGRLIGFLWRESFLLTDISIEAIYRAIRVRLGRPVVHMTTSIVPGFKDDVAPVLANQEVSMQ